MKKAEIKIGGHYRVMVSGKLVTVRVDAIRDEIVGRGTTNSPKRSLLTYHVTNLSTGRKTTFRSAAKFRQIAAEGDDCADPTVRYSASAVLASRTQSSVETVEGLSETKTASNLVTALSAIPTPSATAPTKPSGLAAKIAASKGTGSSPHIIVSALAGTGKTTTLIEGLKIVRGIGTDLTPSPQQAAVWDGMRASANCSSVCFVAFNKSIATELQRRVSQGCEASTMHSMGFRAVNRAFNRPKVNEYRTQDILSQLMNRDIFELRKDKPILVRAVCDLVGYCKMNLADPTQEALEDLASYYDVDLNGARSEAFDLVPRVLDRCKDIQRDNTVDYDDMIWLPVALNLPMPRFGLLLCDEVQDFNRCQQALARMAGERLIMVGDKHQAIYGFAGADSDSIPRMERELSETDRGCQLLPLTVTRRCGRAIVTEAQKYVPSFEAHESNSEGKINHTQMAPGGEFGKDYTGRVSEGDMVLCRTNAPLVSQCFRFLKAGRKATIQGRDVGKGLISTVEKMKAAGVPDLISKLHGWLNQETTKEMAKRFPSETKIQGLEDRVDCLTCFCDGAQTVADVRGKIETIFTDDKSKPGVRFSSVHRAKGLESHRVVILQPKSGPRFDKMQDWERAQENNIRYVGITRAIESLTYAVEAS